MLTMMILPALALAAAPETPALASAIIDCTDRHAAMLASSERSAAAIADATVAACSHTLDRLNEITSLDPAEAERERALKAALRDGAMVWIRARAVTIVERSRSRP
ncbi:MAG TPA: hypothetical protein VF693_01300 [Allosphingosinicella sp.]|jgi:hypothetical protein